MTINEGIAGKFVFSARNGSGANDLYQATHRILVDKRETNQIDARVINFG